MLSPTYGLVFSGLGSGKVHIPFSIISGFCHFLDLDSLDIFFIGLPGSPVLGRTPTDADISLVLDLGEYFLYSS